MDLFTYTLAKGGQGSGGTGITVDSVLSDSSENPVQNKVLKAALDAKAASADVPTDTAQLTNGAGFATPGDLLTYVKKTELSSYPTKDELSFSLAGKQDALSYDTAPTAGSQKMVKSGAVKSAIDSAITNAFAGISQFSLYKCGNGEYDVSTLVPTIQNPDSLHIYLVPDSGSYREYVWVNNAWDLIGTTEVDLTGYVQASDLADVATSGSYNDLSDTPTIPTDTEDLTNGAGYIKKPHKTYISYEPDDQADMGAGIVGGWDHLYLQVFTPTADEVTAINAAYGTSGTLYCRNHEFEMGKGSEGSEILFGYNLEPDPERPSGMKISDPTKPSFGILYNSSENVVTVMSKDEIEGIVFDLYEETDYLTEHQSLAGYATTAAVNTALADYASKSYVDSAVTGKQDTLTFDNSPTANSSNPVKSKGIYTALANKQDTLTFDSTPTSGSPRPVKSGGIYTALAAKANTADLADVATSGSYNDLSDTPTIPTIPEKLVTGSAKAYTVVVANSAPAAGTADSVITIVV